MRISHLFPKILFQGLSVGTGATASSAQEFMQRLIENEDSVLKAVELDEGQADGGDSDKEGTGELNINILVTGREDDNLP